MAISVSCPECGAEFQVSPEMAGRKGKCRRCGGVLVVPTPDSDGDPGESPIEEEAIATTGTDDYESETEDEWEDIDNASEDYSFSSVYETGGTVVSDDHARGTGLRGPRPAGTTTRSRFLPSSTSFASDFFDFRWMVTPKLIRGLFMLLTILTILGLPVGIIYVYYVNGDAMAWWAMILWPFVAVLVTAIQYLLYRAIFEVVMLPFAVHDAIEGIRDTLHEKSARG